MNTWQALGFIALGMLVAHTYNWLGWRKYYEGRGDRYRRSGKQ